MNKTTLNSQKEKHSMLSLRRATPNLLTLFFPIRNFYPRSPCRERRVGPWPCGPARIISIHALLAESDFGFAHSWLLSSYFYPRSPCGERRKSGKRSDFILWISIHALLAESDSPNAACRPRAVYFYPRSPCGERHALRCVVICVPGISIHALLAESDPALNFPVFACALFLSTLSLRRATPLPSKPRSLLLFLSTLSLRRATLPLARPGPCLCDFYPRSPCGERRKINGCVSLYSTFLSTLSLRRATSSCTSRERATLFLSTLSLRRATGAYPGVPCGVFISIHALLAESDIGRA